MTDIRSFEPGLYSAGQPTPDELADLARRGVRTVINLRHPDEPIPFDERAEAARLGLRYVSIPVAGAADLDRHTVGRFSQALAEARTEGDTLIHCASANRVGALVALEQGFVRGASIDQALAAGRSAGLAGLEPTVTDLLSQQPLDLTATDVQP